MKVLFYIIGGISVIISEVSSLSVGTTPQFINKILETANGSEIRNLLNSSRRVLTLNSRRILNGFESEMSRPYMVYLKLPSNNPKSKDYRQWLCGGVIIHEEYILTSAACIEDVRNFYIVSGTYKYHEGDDKYNNLCIKNGAKKAIWKCVPKNYEFDGHENDNIRWMNNDIAVVKVEDEFDFSRRIRGCDYTPKPICYNNQSARYEDPEVDAVVAGWGSTFAYRDWISRRQHQGDGQLLLEARVKILSKLRCKRRWGRRYHNIIDNYMICTKDSVPELSEACQEKYVDCTDINYSDDSNEQTRRSLINPEKLILHSARNDRSPTRRADIDSGGFCENDHGGPLIYGSGFNAVVIGIISACLVKERSNACYGPFLYTSVYKNMKLINCAVYKDVAGSCDKVFRADFTHTETEFSWTDHPDGPSKHDIRKMRRLAEEAKQNQTSFKPTENITSIRVTNSTEPSVKA